MASRLAWSLGQPLPQHLVPFQKMSASPRNKHHMHCRQPEVIPLKMANFWFMLKIVEMFNRSIHQKPTYRIIESVHPCTPIYECHKRSSWTWSNHWGNKKDTTWDSGFQNIYLHMLEFTNPKKNTTEIEHLQYTPLRPSPSQNHLSH